MEQNTIFYGLIVLAAIFLFFKKGGGMGGMFGGKFKGQNHYELNRYVPGMNAIKPNVIVFPDGSGRFESAIKTGDTWRFNLTNGKFLRGVDIETDIRWGDLMALLAGNGTIQCRINSMGERVPSFFGADQELDRMKAVKDYHQQRAATFETISTIAPNTMRAQKYAEDTAAAVGRMRRKAAGVGVVGGLRAPPSEMMLSESDFELPPDAEM